jgi:ABC-type sugar transport system ATPase subunit
VRPEQVEIVDASAAAAIRFTVDVVETVEPDMLVFAKADGTGLGGAGIIVRTPNNDRRFVHGEPIHLHFPSEALHAFDAVTGARLP